MTTPENSNHWSRTLSFLAVTSMVVYTYYVDKRSLIIIFFFILFNIKKQDIDNLFHSCSIRSFFTLFYKKYVSFQNNVNWYWSKIL